MVTDSDTSSSSDATAYASRARMLYRKYGTMALTVILTFAFVLAERENLRTRIVEHMIPDTLTEMKKVAPLKILRAVEEEALSCAYERGSTALNPTMNCPSVPEIVFLRMPQALFHVATESGWAGIVVGLVAVAGMVAVMFPSLPSLKDVNLNPWSLGWRLMLGTLAGIFVVWIVQVVVESLLRLVGGVVVAIGTFSGVVTWISWFLHSRELARGLIAQPTASAPATKPKTL